MFLNVKTKIPKNTFQPKKMFKTFDIPPHTLPHLQYFRYILPEKTTGINQTNVVCFLCCLVMEY